VSCTGTALPLVVVAAAGVAVAVVCVGQLNNYRGTNCLALLCLSANDLTVWFQLYFILLIPWLSREAAV
jgi:hypothetical protein